MLQGLWIYTYLVETKHLIYIFTSGIYEPQHEKTNNVDFDQVWHKPGCAATGDG